MTKHPAGAWAGRFTATLAIAASMTAAPVAADRDRDRLVAGALILGAVGLAIADARSNDRAPDHDSQRAQVGQALDEILRPLGVQSSGQAGSILGPVHITPARPLFTGPGGVPPGTRSDPLAGLGPLPTTGTLGVPYPTPGASNGIVSDGSVLTPLAQTPGIAPPDPMQPVTVQPLPPANATAPASVPSSTLPSGPVIPATCLATYDSNGENLALYAPGCLAERTTFAADLPVTCARTLRTLGRFVSGYDPACLSTAGYVLADPTLR